MMVTVTGATGTIGQMLVRKLAETGHTVTALSRSGKNDMFFNGPGVFYKRVDIVHDMNIHDAIRGSDAVFHLAAATHSNRPGEYHSVNVSGTKRVIVACVNTGIRRFIFISSRTAGLNGGDYSVSKFDAENLLQSSGLDWTIIRPSEVYGKGNDYIHKLVKLVRFSFFIPVFGDGNYTVNPVYCDDVVNTLPRLLPSKKAIHKTYTLAGPEEMSYNTFVKTVIQAMHLKRIILHLPWGMLAALAKFCAITGYRAIAADQLPRLLIQKSGDIHDAEIDLDFHPRQLVEGISGLL